jgi:CDP-diacylglycerol--glycerol-3-phosphate 3-phosphatidyltransferase
MSLANLITLARGVAIVPVVALLVSGERWAAWWLFACACATDPIDGLVARRRNEVTRLGKVLDPLVDKAMYLSVLFSLYVLGDLPTWIVALFLIPQAAIGVGAIVLRARRNAIQAARLIGKGASALAFVAIAFLVANWPGALALFYAATAATYLAGLDYFLSALRLMRPAASESLPAEAPRTGSAVP